MMEWDLLFLIPWPWLGPWPAPVIVAVLLAAWGGRVLAVDPPCRLGGRAAVLTVAGTVLVLLSFLQPAFGLLGDRLAVAAFEPGEFWWGAFVPGVLLMGAGMVASFGGEGREGPGDLNGRG